jgi:two-component system cell cycle sensor histidine kinase/response regulator CckA
MNDSLGDSKGLLGELEVQRHQAQRLESLGRFASGIAHDFNAHLTIVLGYSEMVLDRVAPDDPIREPLQQIRMAAERLTTLTQQLLAFGRHQVVQPQRIDLNAIIESLVTTLSRAVGPSISISTNLQSDAWPVNVDRSQMEQVLVNLALNARDAMPQGGSLRISTANVHESPQATVLALGMGGDLVKLSVTDSGVGMPSETLSRIFEPFFTTKPAGSGSGLGLAMVYGIVRQSGGAISVESELGRGSTFHVFLPRHTEVPRDTAQGAPAPTGTETYSSKS